MSRQQLIERFVKYPNCEPDKWLTLAEVYELIDLQHVEIGRLQAIVDQYPKTRDGVPITPLMIVYVLINNKPIGGRVLDISGDRIMVITECGVEAHLRLPLLPSECYSTLEAAWEFAVR